MLSNVSFFNDPPTVLDAINVAKIGTGAVIFILAGKYGFTPRSTIYTGLHVSYLCWWMLEQVLFPPFQGRFTIEADPAAFVVIFLVIGVFYALPAFNVFIRPPSSTPSTFVSVACVMMFTLGSLINTMADVQMHTTKSIQKGLVTEGIFALSQNPNYLGDWMRYGSFCLISGRKSSFLLLALVVGMNLGSLQDPATKGKMAAKYGEQYSNWIAKVPNKVIPMLSTNTLMIIGIVVAVWFTCFGLGMLSKKNKVTVHVTKGSGKSKAN